MTTTSSARRRALVAAPLALGLGLAAVLVADPAHAATIEVDTEADLAAAITTANADPDQDTIALTGDITLTAALPWIREDLIIEGNSHTIHASGLLALRFVSVDAEVHRLTIAGPSVGIHATNGSLLVTNVTMTGVTATGLQMGSGDFELRNSSFTGTDATSSYGLYLIPSGAGGNTMTVTDTSFTDFQYGLSASINAPNTVEIRNVTAQSNYIGGTVVGYVGGHITLAGSSFLDNEYTGAAFTMRGSTTGFLEDVESHRNGGHGLEIGGYDDATVDVSGTTTDSNVRNGISVSASRSATVVMTGIEATGNASAGVSSIARGPDASLELFDLRLASNRVNLSAAPIDEGRITATGAVLRGGLYGFEVLDPARLTALSGTVTVSGAEIIGSEEHGVHLPANLRDVDVHFVDGTISGIDVDQDGAAVHAAVHDATLTIERTTIFDTASSAPAGGIFVHGDGTGAFRLLSSTLTGNSSDSFASALLAENLAELVVAHSTIVGNLPTTDSSVVLEQVADATIHHTVIDGGDMALMVDVPANLTADHNLVGSADGGTAAALAAGTGNIPGSPDPMLGALADNGGPTPTMLPLLGSPLLDAGDPAFTAPPATDQRLQNRVSNDRIDIGAVEVQVAEPAELPATGATASWLAPVAVGLLVLGAIGLAVPVRARSRRV